MSSKMTRIERWFGAHLSEFLADLSPGCSEAELAELERLVGTDLPDDFMDLYRWRDGQKTRHYSGIFYGLPFISLAEVRQEWLGWKPLFGDSSFDSPSFKSAPSGAIKEMYASPGWIPFAIDGGGNSLGIDLDPGPAGTRGQVINFGRDEFEKFVLAPSLDAFFVWLAGQLEKGNFSITEVPDAPLRGYAIQSIIPRDPSEEEEATPIPSRKVLNTKAPPTLHFLDSVKVMFADQRER
jgi:cell wall assembly regulator SMI1